MRRHSGWIWCGRIVAVVLLAGLISYLSVAGLDKADKLASVLTLLVAVAALAAPYLLPPAQDSAAQPAPAPAPAAEPSQSVVNAVVMGRLTQAKDVGGLQVPVTPPSGAAPAAPPATTPAAAPPATTPAAAPPVTAPSAPAGAPPAAAPIPGGPGGQYVNGVWVGGDLTQIDGVNGDVTLG